MINTLLQKTHTQDTPSLYFSGKENTTEPNIYTDECMQKVDRYDNTIICNLLLAFSVPGRGETITFCVLLNQVFLIYSQNDWIFWTNVMMTMVLLLMLLLMLLIYVDVTQ